MQWERRVPTTNFDRHRLLLVCSCGTLFTRFKFTACRQVTLFNFTNRTLLVKSFGQTSVTVIKDVKWLTL